MSVMIYGIKNCSTMKKAFDKLTALGIDYQFTDYKKQPPDKSLLQDWVNSEGLDKILNKKGMTWRNLPESEKSQALQSQESAINLMMANPSMIKRPIIISGDDIIVGYDETKIEALK